MGKWETLWHQTLPQREISRRIQEQIEQFRDSYELTEAYIERVFKYIDRVWGDDILLGDCKVVMEYKVYHVGVPDDLRAAAAWVAGNLLCVNAELLNQLFVTEKYYYVGGIQLCDVFSVLMHVLLHEYVHVFMHYARRCGMYDWRDVHGPEFMKRIQLWYGHTDHQHSLIPGFQENRIMRQAEVGQKVRIFVDRDHYVLGHIVERTGNEIKVKGCLCPSDRAIQGVVTHVGRIICIIN
jgi:hypothetical protein